MTSVFDVAAYILEKRGAMSAMKLQKLCYYSQAWSLVWDGVPLFAERIEAWRDGPVIRELFSAHKGQFTVESIASGSSAQLKPSQRQTVDAVLEAYGSFDGATLSRMSHDEKPWQLARQSVPADSATDAEISRDQMKAFYSSL